MTEPICNEKCFDFWEWSASDFITARPLKKYITNLKAQLVGTQISAIHTMGVIFNNYDDETLDVWDAKGCVMLDEPIVLICGYKQFEICFHNTSHAKIGINTLTMAEKSYQHVLWSDVSRLFPNIAGQKISDIKLTTFSEGFYDSVFMGDGSRRNGGDYFETLIILLENGFVLLLSGEYEYMWAIQRPISECQLFPTDSRWHFNDMKKPASCLSFVPVCDKKCDKLYSDCEKKCEKTSLSIKEEDWDMLHWSIRYIFPDYDKYENDFPVSIADWERIISAWSFIFTANTFDEVYEKFCGIDYESHSVKNENLMYYFNHKGYLWKNRDSAWEIFDDFMTWFDKIKSHYLYIRIYGI